MTDPTEADTVARAVDLLDGCQPYFNVATESDGQPWNSPVWAVRERGLALYWSSWVKAVHSRNIARNPKTFLTLFDSTRKRGTNNMRCLYLQCVTVAVDDADEAARAFALLYPGEAVDVRDFLGDGQKRFYRARPLKAWLNSLSERELSPSTTKMRVEVPLERLAAALAAAPPAAGDGRPV